MVPMLTWGLVLSKAVAYPRAVPRNCDWPLVFKAHWIGLDEEVRRAREVRRTALAKDMMHSAGPKGKEMETR